MSATIWTLAVCLIFHCWMNWRHTTSFPQKDVEKVPYIYIYIYSKSQNHNWICGTLKISTINPLLVWVIYIYIYNVKNPLTYQNSSITASPWAQALLRIPDCAPPAQSAPNLLNIFCYLWGYASFSDNFKLEPKLNQLMKEEWGTLPKCRCMTCQSSKRNSTCRDLRTAIRGSSDETLQAKNSSQKSKSWRGRTVSCTPQLASQDTLRPYHGQRRQQGSPALGGPRSASAIPSLDEEKNWDRALLRSWGEPVQLRFQWVAQWHKTSMTNIPLGNQTAIGKHVWINQKLGKYTRI